jgi:hypothetical protein
MQYTQVYLGKDRNRRRIDLKHYLIGTYKHRQIIGHRDTAQKSSSLPM